MEVIEDADRLDIVHITLVSRVGLVNCLLF